MKKLYLKRVESLNYKNDPLLSNDKIFLKGYVNIYSALLKSKDMLNNKKGRVLKRCPYVSETEKHILKLVYRLKDQKFITLRQILANYLKINEIREDTFRGWLNKKTYPLPLVRILCFLTNKDTLKILKGKTITDFCNRSRVIFPTFHAEICSDFMAYFVGLHFGDGTLNEERWKIVDGDRELKNLKYSFEFLTKIKNKLEKIFLINSFLISKCKNKNAYELIISNKWFGRYLNFVYGIEYYRKKKPIIPALFRGKERFILRGLFDTDGSIKDYRIGIGTKYYSLYRKICRILTKYDISYREKINRIRRKNEVYMLEIDKGFTHSFIAKIGFSHPRKLLETKKYLLTKSASKNFIGYKKSYKPRIFKKDFFELCTFLRPIKNYGKIMFISKFNKLSSTKKKDY